MDAPNLFQDLSLHQLEAEKLFAGCVFIDADYARESCGWLEPDKIMDTKIREFWRKVKAGDQPADAAIAVNGFLEISGYMNLTVSSLYLPTYAETIATDIYLRKSAAALSGMAQAISKRETSALKELAQSIAEQSPETDEHLPDAVDIGAEYISSLDDIEGRIETTGLPSLDYAIGGFEQETLTIIAGRPGMGKTSFGLQGSVANAKAGRRVLFFSLEMSKRNLWARLVAGRSHVQYRDIKAKRATQEQLERQVLASTQLMEELEDRWIVEDRPSLTNDEVWQRVAKVKPDIVFLDHLALVDGHIRSSNSGQEVIRLGNISRRGKVIAKTFHIPVVYLAQLNRESEHRDNKRPVLADLRGSGEIEQDADNVIFLYRPDYYNEVEDNGTTKAGITVVDAEVIAAKIRDGRANIRVNTKFNLEEQIFYPVKKEGK